MLLAKLENSAESLQFNSLLIRCSRRGPLRAVWRLRAGAITALLASQASGSQISNMWCGACQQDVPAVVAAGGQGFTCPRCGNTATEAPPTSTEAGLTSVRDDGLDLDVDWRRSEVPRINLDLSELESQLRQANNLLKQSTNLGVAQGDEMVGSTVQPFTLRQPAEPVVPPTASMATGFDVAPPKEKPAPRRVRSPLSWLLVGLGVTVLSGGVSLLVWSWVLMRPELWNHGLIGTIIGHVAVLLGLLVRLERVWSLQRAACQRMIEVDTELADVKKTAHLLGAQPNHPTQAFYSHLAHGASPHILVADLQGQLELLAKRLANQR